MSDIWLNDLVDSYTFSGDSALSITINVGDEKPWDTSIELIDFLLSCSAGATAEPLTISVTNISSIDQVCTWYYRSSMENVTSIYYDPEGLMPINAGSLVNITWDNTGAVSYSGVLRFTYRGEVSVY